MDRYARPEEADVRRLLAESGLPTADITAQHLHHFFGCGSEGKLEGVVGLELCGDAALLRSLAVTAAQRGLGLGSELVEHAEGYAWGKGVESLYLLTTTAEAFFRRRGYVCIPRDEAPPAVKATREFSAICPASSALMVKHLAGNPQSLMRNA